MSTDTPTTPTQRRRAWHQSRLDKAPDARLQFWEACNRLAAVVRRRGRVDGDLHGALTRARDLILNIANTIERGGTP